MDGTRGSTLSDLEVLALFKSDTFTAKEYRPGTWGVFDQNDHIRASCTRENALMIAWALEQAVWGSGRKK